jgi:hypothetical protein
VSDEFINPEELPIDGNDQPAEVPAQPEQNEVEDLFAQAEEAFSLPVSARTITLRHEANPARYVPLYEGEPGVTIRTALDRLNLTVGGGVIAYYNNSQAAFDTLIPEGGVVTLIGNVKGG